MASLAYFPLYPKDFLGATGRLNAEKFGVYTRLLYTSWFEPLNDDIGELAFLVGSSKRITKQILDRYFVLKNGVWENHRLEKERTIADKKHKKAVDSGKKGAKLRWGGDSNPISPPISNPSSRDDSKTIATQNSYLINNNISKFVLNTLSEKGLIYQKTDVPIQIEKVYSLYGEKAALYIINKINGFTKASQQQQPNYINKVIQSDTPILMQIKAGKFDEHGEAVKIDLPRILRKAGQ